MRIFKTIIVFLAFTSSSLAQNGITLGYVTGNDYLKLSEVERTSWVVGVMDGIMSEAVALSKDPKGPWLGRCVRGLPTSQIKAMFDKSFTRTQIHGMHPQRSFFVTGFQRSANREYDAF